MSITPHCTPIHLQCAHLAPNPVHQQNRFGTNYAAFQLVILYRTSGWHLTTTKLCLRKKEDFDLE